MAPAPSPAWSRDQMADRKSTRLNSSHLVISYAVFCLKKKPQTKQTTLPLQIERPPQPNAHMRAAVACASRHRAHSRTLSRVKLYSICFFFFLNDPAPPEISPFPPHGTFPI